MSDVLERPSSNAGIQGVWTAVCLSDQAVCAWVRRLTLPFVQSATGKWFLALTLLGPLIYSPTVWEVWTAPNIDAFRTNNWPLLALLNVPVFISVCHHGDGRMRVCTIAWFILMALIWIATLVR
ncbi:hypothetical protein K2Q16_00045 [Patescibacteria group bacterium]|nr:hypothetical protein [Patescibacteria group bacterium]